MAAERERQKQLEEIKKQYLGEKKQKKKILKPSEKFKYDFSMAVACSYG